MCACYLECKHVYSFLRVKAFAAVLICVVEAKALGLRY